MEDHKKYSPQRDVAQFMIACDQTVHDNPTMPDRATLLLRAKLLFEETLEFIKGSGMVLAQDPNTSKIIVVDPQNKDGYIFAGDEAGEPNLQEMYDAIVDINYVSYGAACAMGLDVSMGHDEVHRSNMTKVSPDGKVTKNEFGKIMKPKTFSPADLKAVLDKQGYRK